MLASSPAPRTNPFPGLRPFRSDEDYLFFGREEQTAELVTLLRQHRFLAVVGTSGSGKSSLVRAGLLPELLGGMMQSAGSAWEVALSRPGGSPVENLARGLIKADLYDAENKDTLLRLLATLGHSARGLVEAYRQSEIEAESNLLVVVDQFEELFRFQEHNDLSRNTARVFVNLLLEASRSEDAPIYVVLTMRSDYLGDCSLFPGLAEAVNNGEYLIPRLGRAQIKRAIEGPVGVGGAVIANRLVQHLINEVGDDQDQLPVLQHALMRTWSAWSDEQAEGEPIDLQHYEATGGMAEALSRHADEVFADLPDDRLRTVAEKIFRVLTEKGSDNRGVRRPTRLENLAAAASATLEEASAVADAYRAPGVTFLMPGEEQALQPSRVIDLSHESLMRVWRRLRDWVEDEAQSARIYRRLADTAQLWKAGEAGLYHDPDLGIAQSWREANEPNAAWADLYGGDFDSAFKLLDASHEQAAKEEREKEEARLRELKQAKELAEAREKSALNFKRFALGMGAVAAVALAAFVFALVKRKEAEEAQGDALKAQKSAESAEGAAKASATAARKAREELRLEFARSDQSLAQTFVDGGMTGRAIAHLARTLKPEYLPDNPEAIDRIFSLLAHHSPPRYHAPPLNYGDGMHYVNAATTDGALLATSDWNAGEQRKQDVRVWAPGSEEAISLPGHHPWHRSLDFSPDGRFLFVGQTTQKPGLLFDTATRELVREFPQTGIVSARYSVDGKQILTGSHNDRRAVVWNAETGEVLFETPTTAFYPAWSPDETRIALGHHRDDTTGVIEAASGDLDELALPGSLTEGVVAWSPDGRRLLTRTRDDAKLWVWELESEAAEPRTPLFSLAHNAQSLANEPRYYNETPQNIYTVGAFSPDGQRILTAGSDQTVRLWNATDGAPLGIPQPLSPLVGRDWLPLFSSDGRRVMLRSRDGRCWVADFDPAAETVPEFGPAIPLQEGYAFLANRGTLKPLLLPHDDVTAAAAVPGGRLVLLGNSRGHAARYDALTGERQGALLRHPGDITAVAVSADGSKLATGSSLGTVMVWDAAASQPLAPVLDFPDPAPGGILGLSFASDGIVLTVFDPTGVTIWDAASGERIRGGSPSTEAVSGITSDDGELIVRAIGSQVSVEKRSTGERVCGITHDTAVTAVALSADNSLLATTDRGIRNVVQLWSVATGQPVGPPMAHDSPVLSLAFRSDRTALVSGCARGAHLWSVPAGTSLDRLPIAGAGQCTQAIFSPNGRTLATAFANGSESFAQVWECATGRAVTVPLTTGAGISDLVFLEGGDRLLVWPTRGTDGIAALWDVSVSDGQSSPAWLPKAAEALGGMKLDDESSPVAVNDRTSEYASIRGLPGQTRLERLVQWLLEFPGTRSDSPFRPRASEAYVARLSESTSMALLEEAVRLAPENGRALALRACVRPALGNQSGAQTLSRADLIRARLLIQASNESLLRWCEAITLDRMNEETAAIEEAYAKARESAPLQGSALRSIVAIQERFETNERARRHLLGIAMTSAEHEAEAIRLRARRFRLAAENGDFEAAREDWKTLKELPAPPPDVDFKTLLTTYLAAVEVEADRLVAAEDWDAAIALARPAALAAELAKPRTGEPGEDVYWETTGFLAKLVDWENRDNRQAPLISMGSVWNFLDDGSDQGVTWRGPDFDESAWEKSGPAPLGYGDGREATLVDFGSDGTNKHITTYFRRRFEVPEEAETKFVYLDLVRDDGAVVYLNGREAGRSQMPVGPVTYQTEASSPQVGGANETREFRLPIDPGLLQPGSNVIAVEIHQEKSRSSDLNFDLRLIASGYAPVQYLAEQLDGESGQKLFAETAVMIPRPDRVTWERDLKFALSPAVAEDTEGLPDQSWILRYDAQAGSGGWQDARETAERRGSILANDLSPVAQRQIKDWLKREELALVRLRSPAAEIEAVQAEIFAAPPPDSSRDPKQIDLTNYFTASLFDDRAWVKAGSRAYHLGKVPETFFPRHGVSFDIRGVVQLESGNLPDGDTFNSKYGHSYPSEVKEIEIGQKSPEVHFLVSCQWGRAEPGTEVGRFVMNFADGSSKEMAVPFGDVSDWFVTSSSVRVPPDKVGWHGWIGVEDAREVIVSELIWKNPYPDQTIESIDFISDLEAAAPFLLGITLK